MKQNNIIRGIGISFDEWFAGKFPDLTDSEFYLIKSSFEAGYVEGRTMNDITIKDD